MTMLTTTSQETTRIWVRWSWSLRCRKRTRRKEGKYMHTHTHTHAYIYTRTLEGICKLYRRKKNAIVPLVEEFLQRLF